MAQKEMPFKGISYLELWQPFCSAEWNHLYNFGRGYYSEQFCEIIFNLGQWFKRICSFKDFLSGALAAFLFGPAEPFRQFCKRHHGEHSFEVIWNLDQWFMRCLKKKKLPTDARQTKTYQNSSPWDFGSGELKKQAWCPLNQGHEILSTWLLTFIIG